MRIPWRWPQHCIVNGCETEPSVIGGVSVGRWWIKRSYVRYSACTTHAGLLGVELRRRLIELRDVVDRPDGGFGLDDELR